MRQVLLAIACLMVLGYQIAAAGGPGVLSGAVVDAEQSAGIPGATVTLMKMGGPQQTTRSDESGQYSFAGLEAGEYRLRAERVGYTTLDYGGRSPRVSPMTLQIAADQSLTDVDFVLSRSPVIAGVVMDELNQPVLRARVMALRRGYRAGRHVLSREAATVTNDLGEFRIADLAAGNYVLLAIPPSAGGDAAGSRYIRTFSGGVTDSEGAATVSVRPGEAAKTTIRLVNGKLARVAGRLSGVSPAATVALTLSVPDAQSIGELGHYRATVDPTGRFTFPEVAPGSYVMCGDSQPPKPDLTTECVRISAADSGTTEMSMALLPPTRVTGALIAHGLSGAGLPTLSISLTPKFDGRAGLVTKSDGGGKFAFDRVPPGSYALAVAPLAGYYVQRVTLDGRESEDGVLHVFPGRPALSVSVELSANGATLAGVVSSGGQPAPDALLIVAPTGQRHANTGFYHTAFTNGKGVFQIPDIAPGQYSVVAMLDLEPGAEYDTAVLAALQPWAVPVRLEQGAAQTVQLTVAPPVGQP